MAEVKIARTEPKYEVSPFLVSGFLPDKPVRYKSIYADAPLQRGGGSSFRQSGGSRGVASRDRSETGKGQAVDSRRTPRVEEGEREGDRHRRRS